MDVCKAEGLRANREVLFSQKPVAFRCFIKQSTHCNVQTDRRWAVILEVAERQAARTTNLPCNPLASEARA